MSMNSTVEPRERLLDAAAIDVARLWAGACRIELKREGRKVEGGWPGTMAEARTRVGAEVTKILRARSLPPLSYDELGRLVRLAYDEARRSWSSFAERRPRQARS
jgi:hypothetical protein